MKSVLVGAGALAIFSLFGSEAEAQSLIKRPNAHPDYVVELEPHGTMLPWRRSFGPYRNRNAFGDPEFGAGFRATIEIVDEGFIPDLNNTVGITFGLDLTNCLPCRRDVSLFLPVAGVQWNFFFTKNWSAFGEVGAMLRTDGFYDDIYGDLMLEVGGRYHFNDDVGLALRIGYPFVTFGPTFFAG